MRELWIPQVEWSRAGRLALVWMLRKDIKKTANTYWRKRTTRNQNCKSCHHSTFVSFITPWRIGSLTKRSAHSLSLGSLTQRTIGSLSSGYQLIYWITLFTQLFIFTAFRIGSNFSFRVFLKSVSELSFRRRGRPCTPAKPTASLNKWLFNEAISPARAQSPPRRLKIVDCWHLHGSIALL